MDIKRPFENERSLFLFKPYKLQNKKGVPKSSLWYTFLRIIDNMHFKFNHDN
jgi:hypothetical protein